MSRQELILKLDAAFATGLNVGDKVRKGDYIGLDSNTQQPLVVSEPGTVKSISFDSEEHCFTVVISEV